MSLLSAHNLSKSYRIKDSDPVEVLTNVSLEIAESEMISIVGASGSGKSTLLHLLGGLDKPNNGQIYYNHEDISQYNNSKLAEFRNQKIGFVFQFHHLMPEFTALENVIMPALIAGIKRSRAETEAQKIMEQLGLSHRLHHRPSQLSGGEQQRVAVARAFINHPSIILADEPTGNLDEENSAKMLSLFFNMVSQFNTSLILVTHDTQIAGQCSRTLLLTRGELKDH